MSGLHVFAVLRAAIELSRTVFTGYVYIRPTAVRLELKSRGKHLKKDCNLVISTHGIIKF